MIEAESQTAAIEQIIRQGGVPLEVKAAPGPRSGNTVIRPMKSAAVFIKKVKPRQVAAFTRQMSDLTAARIPVLTALGIIRQQTRAPALGDLVQSLYRAVEDGSALSQALKLYPEVFSPMYVHMVRAGEVAGDLDQGLARLADHGEKTQALKARIMASLAYPLFILAVGGITVAVLVTFVIPQLSLVFDDLGQDLPLITVWLMAVTDGCLRFGWLGALGLAAVAGALAKGYQRPAVKERIDRFVLKVPFYGRLVRLMAVSHFARTLAALLRSGVSLDKALKAVARTFVNARISSAVTATHARVLQGEPLHAALQRHAIFPRYAVNMIAVGESTGRLEHSLQRVAVTFERETDQIIKAGVSLIGPLVLAGVVALIGAVIVAMLLPLFSMNTFF